MNLLTNACGGVLFCYIRREGDGVPQNRREADDSCHAEDAGGFVMCAKNAVLFIALTPRLFVNGPVRARDRAASLDTLNPAFESLS